MVLTLAVLVRFSSVCFDGHKFRTLFYCADVQSPIIGADFLCHHKLLVYLTNNHLVDATRLSSIICSLDNSHSSGIQLLSSINDPYLDLLSSFPELTCLQFTSREPSHGVLHFIPTKGRLVFSHPRHLSLDKLRAAKAEFDSMLQMGIIQPSRSQWASPLHMVPELNGEWFPCGDYCQLNQVSIPDRYPVPHI